MQFDKYTGPPFTVSNPTCIPIPPISFDWSDGSTRLSRQQLPLMLSGQWVKVANGDCAISSQLITRFENFHICARTVFLQLCILALLQICVDANPPFCKFTILKSTFFSLFPEKFL